MMRMMTLIARRVMTLMPNSRIMFSTIKMHLAEPSTMVKRLLRKPQPELPQLEPSTSCQVAASCQEVSSEHSQWLKTR